MDKLQRRTLSYVTGLLVVIAAFTALYHYGMATFEGESLSVLHSLQVVVETFTTTGFGSDAPWISPEMNLIVIVMDLVGVVMIFLALPALVFPLLQDVLSTTVPKAVSGEPTNHVVVCTHTPRTEALTDELESWGVEYVVVEPDRDRAVELHEAGGVVINADPESVEGLENARVRHARAVVADVSDEVDASIVLTAKEVAEDVRVVSVVEDPDTVRYHELAGADSVLTPRTLLGESLARKVTTAIEADVGDAIEIGSDLEIAELSIHRGSELAGRTLADSGIRERSGANVVGAWFDGAFESPPSPDSTLDAGTTLVVTGTTSQLESLKALTRSESRRVGPGETVVVGHGEVGRTVAAELDDAGVPHTVLDLVEQPGVDAVGDGTDADALRDAGVLDARSVVLALPEDTTTEFATLVVRDLTDDVEILARAEETENVQKMHRAGADYALSLATITGRMLASTILEAENVISLDTQVEVVQTTASGLVGSTLGDADVRSLTGCTVIGVERDGEVLTDLGPGFPVQHGDEVIIAGTTEGTNRFHELLG
jgi:Trk K+ transport system NAD-binding subunit